MPVVPKYRDYFFSLKSKQENIKFLGITDPVALVVCGYKNWINARASRHGKTKLE